MIHRTTSCRRLKTEVAKGVAQQYVAQHPPIMSDLEAHPISGHISECRLGPRLASQKRPYLRPDPVGEVRDLRTHIVRSGAVQPGEHRNGPASITPGMARQLGVGDGREA